MTSPHPTLATSDTSTHSVNPAAAKSRLGLLLCLLLVAQPIQAEDAVSFSTNVLPLLQKNCLACHNETEQEGELIMESVARLLDGGDSGPAIIPGQADESLLYQLASHEEEPVMPPVDNDVGAKRLSPAELQILKSWINQGAKDEVASESETPAIDWRPIPDEQANILALELSPDGRWLASGRGNRLMIYSVPQQRLQQTLVDPDLSESHDDGAHLDSIQSIAWSPDQSLIASGGFRVVKIWQRQAAAGNETPEEKQTEAQTPDKTRSVQINSEGEASTAKLLNLSDGKEIAALKAELVHQESWTRAEFEHGLRTQKLGVFKADVEAAKKRKTEAENDVKKATEEIKKATDDVPKKEEALAKSKEAFDKQDAAVKADEAMKSELTVKIEQLGKDLAAAEGDAKGKLEQEKKTAEEERKKLEDGLTNKSKERDKLKKDLEKKQQELDDAKKTVERANAAKKRLEEIVVTRQTQIDAANTTLAEHQKVVDESAKSLESLKQQPVAPWIQVQISADGTTFSLLNAGGYLARFATADGSLLSVDSSSAVGAWKLLNTLGNPNGESPFADRITSLSFRHDGKVLAIGGGEPSRSGEVQLWATDDWTQIGEVVDIHSDVVYDLQFAPLGNNLVSCGSDRMVKLIDGETAKHIRTFEGHTGHVLGVSWRADGRTLATAGADQVVKVWDAEEGGQKKTISGFKGEVTAVRYMGLDNRMVFSTGKGDIHSRDSEGNNKPGFGKLTDYVHRVSCSRDGKIVAAAGTNRTVRVWDSEGKQIAEFK